MLAAQMNGSSHASSSDATSSFRGDVPSRYADSSTSGASSSVGGMGGEKYGSVNRPGSGRVSDAMSSHMGMSSASGSSVGQTRRNNTIFGNSQAGGPLCQAAGPGDNPYQSSSQSAYGAGVMQMMQRESNAARSNSQAGGSQASRSRNDFFGGGGAEGKDEFRTRLEQNYPSSVQQGPSSGANIMDDACAQMRDLDVAVNRKQNPSRTAGFDPTVPGRLPQKRNIHGTDTSNMYLQSQKQHSSRPSSSSQRQREQEEDHPTTGPPHITKGSLGRTLGGDVENTYPYESSYNSKYKDRGDAQRDVEYRKPTELPPSQPRKSSSRGGRRSRGVSFNDDANVSEYSQNVGNMHNYKEMKEANNQASLQFKTTKQAVEEEVLILDFKS